MAVYLDSGERVRTTNELVDWWIERAAQTRKPDDLPQSEEKSSIIARGDSLFHYGSHFELARIVRTKGGRPKMFVLNGDSSNLSGHYGPSTGERQRQVETGVRATGIPYITIPFSALGAAGVDISSVKPLEVRPDRRETIRHESNERPGKPVMIPHPDGLTHEVLKDRNGYVHRDTRQPYRDSEGRAVHPPHPASQDYVYGTYVETVTEPVMVESEVESTVEKTGQHEWSRGSAHLHDGVWVWHTERHWLGDSLFKGRVTEERTRLANDEEREIFLAHEEWSADHRELRNVEDDARRTNSNLQHVERQYEREESLRLGDNPPPRPTADELESAYNAVTAAVEAVRAHGELEPNRSHAERHRGTKRLIVRHTVRRWAKFLSSFDYNEPHRPYFMCELRYGCPANTVDEAIEDLKPPVIRDALDAGLDVLRHGDVFLVPTSLTTNELKSRAVTFKATRTVEASGYAWDDEAQESRWRDAVTVTYDEPIRKLRGQGDATVLGTNHSATWVVLTNDGDYYVSGTVYHTPTGWGRNPEHRALKLGKPGQAWYRCVKNTVPLDKSSGGSRGSRWAGRTRIDQSGQSRAWMLGGAVD